MKKFTILSAVLSVVLFSCSSDYSAHVNKADLVGKWNFETYSMVKDGQLEVPEEPYGGNVGGCSKDYYQFNDDKSAVWSDYHTGACTQDIESGHWQIYGESISFKLDGREERIYKVEEVTPTFLKLVLVNAMLGSIETNTYTFSKG